MGQQTHRRTQIEFFGGLALVCTVVGILCFITFASASALQRSEAWVAHTQTVLEKLGLTLTAVDEAETGQRGYLLTGQESYLGPYSQATAQITPLIDDVRLLTRDNPVQQANLTRLAPAVTHRL